MSALVKDLLDAYEALAAAKTALDLAIHHQPTLPRYLPTFSGEEARERDAVAQSLTQIWHAEPGDDIPMAGIICATTQTVQSVESLNKAKAVFKMAVDAIRKKDKSNSSLFSLADQHLGEDRKNTELRAAMNTARINRLDLLKCYKVIRVLPPSLESLSWTWATTHTKSEPISMDGVVKMAHERLSGETREAVLADLGRLKPGTPMTRLCELPNQLRANIVWNEDGERKRKALSISGIVVFPSEKLPKLFWRDDPGKRTGSSGLTRVDSKINRIPFIRALNVHLYQEQEY